MEKTESRDDHADSSERFAFEPAIAKPNLLGKVSYTDFKPPNDDGDDTAGISPRRRPIRLKADLGVTKTGTADSKKPQVKKGRQKKKPSDSGRRHRPIQLKADVALATGDASNEKQAETKTLPAQKQRTKPAKSRRSIKLKADGAVSAGISEPSQPQRRAVKKKSTPAPQTEAKAPDSVRARKAAPVRADASVAAKESTEIPGLEVLEPLLAWVRPRRRLLFIVGLSFISGILVHSWLTPEPPGPTQATEPAQTTQQETIERPASVTQPAPAPKDEYDFYSPPTPGSGGYLQQDQGYRAPTYGSARQQNQAYRDPEYGYARQPQRAFSQYPNQDQRNLDYPTIPQTPLSSTWRPRADQPPTDNRYGTYQKYNPWAPREPQYSPYR